MGAEIGQSVCQVLRRSVFPLIDRLDNLLDNLLDNGSLKMACFLVFFNLKVRTSTLKGENYIDTFSPMCYNRLVR